MTRDELKELLNSRADSAFVREVLSRRPWIFDSDQNYEAWQTSVAGELGVGLGNVRIVGSAATGYSLSPLKPGRLFRSLPGLRGQISDIDIAIIAPNLFVAAWDIILAFDRTQRLGLLRESRAKLRLDVYWGLVGQHTIPRNTEPARRILTAMTVAGRMPPLRGYPIRCRVYRRLEDLEAYHTDSIRQLRKALEAFGD